MSLHAQRLSGLWACVADGRGWSRNTACSHADVSLKGASEISQWFQINIDIA